MPLREAGVRLTLQGEAEYRAGIKGISQEMRTMATESKLAISQLGNNASITNKYNTQMKSLSSEMKIASTNTSALTERQRRLPQVQREISTALESTNRAYKESAERTKALEAEYQKSIGTKGRYAAETVDLGQALEQSKQETKALEAEVKQLSSAYNSNEKELAKLPNQLAKAELATQELRNEQQRLHTEFRNAGGVLADAAKGMSDFGDSAIKIGEGFKSVGSNLTKNVTLPIVATGGLAIKAAMDWETAFAGVMKTNNEVTDSNGNVTYSYADLETELRNLAQTLPVAHEELAGIAESAGQLGIATEDVVGFTEVIAKLGHTTNLSFEEASTALAQFLNVTGSGSDTVENLASSIVALGNNTAATEKDILMMSQRWATTGAMIGLTDDQIVAFSASLIAMGVNVEAGGSSMQRFGQKVNVAVLEAGEELELLASISGTTAQEFADAWNADPAAALVQFLEGLNDVQESGGNVNQVLKELGITSVNEVNAILALAGGHDQLSDALNLSSKAYAENTALGDEFAVFAETTASKVQVLWNRIKDIAIEFGGPLADALTSALDAADPWLDTLADMAEEFSNLDEEGQRTILMWAGIAAAAGPVLSLLGSGITTIGGVSKALSTVIRTLGKWTTPKAIGETVTELGKVPGAATGAGGVATLFSNPWVLAGAAAIAGVGAFVLYMNNEANKPFKAHNEAVDATEGAYQEWFDAVIAGMGSIDDLHTSVDEGVDATTENYKENVAQVLKANQQVQEAIGLTQDASNIFTGLWKSNQMQVEIAGQSMTLRMQNLGDALKELGQSESEISRLNDAFQNYGTTLGTVMSNVITVTQEGKAVTEDWASANIQAIKTVATETVQRLEEKRQAEIENLNQTRDNVGMEADIYEERLAAINSSYDQQINAVSQAQENIRAILSEASNNNRAISDEEVVHILQNMQAIAEGTGKSLSEVEGVAELIGNNLSALVSTTSLDMLVQMGLIDEGMAQNIAGLEDGEAKTRLLAEALGEYAGINVDPKDFELETEEAQAELMELQELIMQWDALTIQEKAAQIEGRGSNELQELITALGVDWNGLTPEQQTAIANAEGKEQVEETLFVLGEWQNLTLEEKRAILTTQIDDEAIASAIGQRDLWNNAEFVSQLATIDTNAPDARQKIIDLINEWSVILGLPQVQMKTSTNAPTTQGQVESLGRSHSALQGRRSRVYTDATDNASGVIASVNRALSNLDGRRSTIYIDTVETGSSRRYARGTQNHPGGLAILGDGGKPEPFLTPGGYFGISPSSDTLYNLPKGTKVWPSMDKIPTYANGTQSTSNKDVAGLYTVNINFDGVTVREDQDIPKIAKEVSRILGRQISHRQRGLSG